MRVIFRVDASIQMGTGHVMRCLTLAQALKENGASVRFICRKHKGSLIGKIRSSGFNVYDLEVFEKAVIDNKLAHSHWLGATQKQDATECINILSSSEVYLLVVDHYGIDEDWHNDLRPYCKKIIVIDDLADRKHNCDFLLDQNYTQDKSRYDLLVSPGAVKFLGPKYALLREDFVKNIKQRAWFTESVSRVFIFFGGTDPDNLTNIALQSLCQSKLKHLFIDVVIGLTNPNRDVIEREVSKNPKATLYIQTDRISELMIKADVSLGSGGMATWERMALGLPSIVITTAENQIPSIKSLYRDGYVVWLGSSNRVDKKIIYNAMLDFIENFEKSREKSRKCQALVSGKGAKNISDLLIFGPSLRDLVVRKAEIADSLLYWYWVNDAVVRENSLSQKCIKWIDHQKWFNDKLKNTNSVLLLVEFDTFLIGQVRFDCKASSCLIDYSIAKQFRGFGLGKVVLREAICHFQKNCSLPLIGGVKKDNIASEKIFKDLGFYKINSHLPLNNMNTFRLQHHLNL
jgi:UDP-2,4-diacetamido-2,4,6-trideoxy-beta-L-altropyranose hydrolase